MLHPMQQWGCKYCSCIQKLTLLHLMQQWWCKCCDCIQELALLHHSQRTATVVSQDVLQLLAIGRHDFFEIFMSGQGRDGIPEHIKYVRWGLMHNSNHYRLQIKVWKEKASNKQYRPNQFWVGSQVLKKKSHACYKIEQSYAIDYTLQAHVKIDKETFFSHL